MSRLPPRAGAAGAAPEVPGACEGAMSHSFTLPPRRRQRSSYGWLQTNEGGSYSVKRIRTASGERIAEGLVLCCIVWAHVRALLLTVYSTLCVVALVKTTRKKVKLCNHIWKFWFGLTFLTGRAWRNMPFSWGYRKGACCKPLALFTACSLHLSV